MKITKSNRDSIINYINSEIYNPVTFIDIINYLDVENINKNIFLNVSSDNKLVNNIHFINTINEKTYSSTKHNIKYDDSKLMNDIKINVINKKDGKIRIITAPNNKLSFFCISSK